MPFLSARALTGLSSYKYKPSGYTLLDDIHQPFWNCECCPLQCRALPYGRDVVTFCEFDLGPTIALHA
jgi:hypothetical protein